MPPRPARLFRRIVNPVNRRLAPIAPWWVTLETTGRRSGRPRQVPLARGRRSRGHVATVEPFDDVGRARCNRCARVGRAAFGTDPRPARVEFRDR